MRGILENKEDFRKQPSPISWLPPLPTPPCPSGLTSYPSPTHTAPATLASSRGYCNTLSSFLRLGLCTCCSLYLFFKIIFLIRIHSDFTSLEGVPLPILLNPSLFSSW